MMNPAYLFESLHELLKEFEPSRAVSLAATKLDECELWLSRAEPRKPDGAENIMAYSPTPRT